MNHQWNDNEEYIKSLLNKREEIWLRHEKPCDADPCEYNAYIQEMRESFTTEELAMMRSYSR